MVGVEPGTARSVVARAPTTMLRTVPDWPPLPYIPLK
jgi:hypothetical protein